MFVLNLADACRLSGLPVIELAGWRTRSTENDGLTRLSGVIWHHTATPVTPSNRLEDYPSLRLVRDGRSDLRGPLSQLGMGRSGTVYIIAGGQASHAGPGYWGSLLGNEDCIGIEMESPGDGTWSTAQRDAMPRLARALTVGLGIRPEMHVAHLEWARPRGRKIDPRGVDMDLIRRAAATPSTPNTEVEDMYGQPERDEVVGRLDELITIARAQHPLVGAIHMAINDPDSGVRRVTLDLAGRPVEEIDEAQLAAAVAAKLSPAALAAALPPELARQVADELAERLSKGA